MMTWRRISGGISWQISGFALALAVLLNSGAANCETPGQIHYMALPGSPPPPRAPAGGLNGRVRFGELSRNGAVVAIYYNRADGDTYICSGVLITRKLVLTAGHCGCGLAGTYWVDTRQDTRAGDTGQLLAVSGAPVLFDQRVCRDGTLANGNDLALIQLRDEIDQDYLDHIDHTQWNRFGYPSTMVFGLRRQIVKGNQLKVVGYGYTESRSIGVRMEGEVPVYSFDCEESGLSGICAPFTEMILAGGGGPANRPANDTCGGDSGGPVYWTGGGGVPLLVAITSRAAPGAQENAALHCGGGGIYTLIGRFSVQDWLRANGVDDTTSDSMDWRRRLPPDQPTPDQLTPDQLKVLKCMKDTGGVPGVPQYESCMFTQ